MTDKPAIQFFPLNWQIICEPIKAKEKVGSIVIAEEAQDTEKHIINCGKIVAMGRLACTEKTNNLDMSVDKEEVVVGAYVMWQRYTGMKMKFQNPDGGTREFVAVSATDLVMALSPECVPMLKYWI